MLRHLYRCALGLHPSAFRMRFGEEMLSIFDSTKGRLPRFLLLMDSIFSLTRQWTLRREFWKEVPAVCSKQVALDGMPRFSTLDRFRPRPAAVIHGVVLTAALFIVTCYAIRYSWIRVLDIRVPALEFEGSPSVHPSASPSELRGRSNSESRQKRKPPASQSETSSAHLYVEPLPVEAQDTAETKVERPHTKAFNSSLGAPVPVLGSLEIRLRSYAGTYLSGSPRITISIEIRGEELVMKREGSSERTLSPLSQTTFLVEGSGDSEVVFGSESDGKFQRLELFEPGRQITALRR
jgi:hypothetical protein